MHVLLIKLSSLGDIVHTLPAVEDGARLGFTFDWVVEEGFAAAPALHRGVRRVIPAALRRWRGSVLGSIGEARAFRTALRRERYGLALDAQGLIKSAVVGRWSRSGEYAGFDRASARESLASALYTRGLAVSREGHAVDRMRALFAAALGYDCPTGQPAFGLEPGQGTGNTCVLVHGTTWNTKHWPDRFWTAIAERAVATGLTPVLPWLSDAERQRAEAVAARVPGAEVSAAMPLADMIALLAGASAVVGVDSGLSHLAAALGRPTVVVFGPTDVRLTGCRGARARSLQSELGCSPCLSRTCRYRGPSLAWQGGTVVPACFADVHPDRVWAEMTRAIAATAAGED